MACVNPDGSLSPSAAALLGMAGEPFKPEEVASKVGQPIFKVRSSIREMAAAGLLREEGGKYVITAAGQKNLES